MILPFHQINAPHDAQQAATNGVVFVAKGPRFMGDKHETWACELVGPHPHAFIQAIHVAWYEVVLHVHPPHLNHCHTSQNLWMKAGEGMLVKVRAERMASNRVRVIQMLR